MKRGIIVTILFLAMCFLALPTALAQTQAYVTALNFVTNEILDGAGTFDLTDGPGNDTGSNNKIIRTFDTITYPFRVNYDGALNADDLELSNTVTLDKDFTQAIFDMNSTMTNYADWKISYQDAGGTEYMYQTAAGLFLTEGNKPITFNEYLDIHGTDWLCKENGQNMSPYRSNIARQVFTFKYTVEQTASSGTQTLNVFVKVTASENGDKIQPEFFSYFVENADNKQGENTITITPIRPEEITVSAAPMYNIRIEKTPSLAYPGYFDLTNGIEVDENQKDQSNVVRGQLVGYGISLELRSTETENKGIMGVELPKCPITFDLVLTEANPGASAQRTNADYMPILWDYRANDKNVGTTNEQGKWGREIYWNNNVYSKNAFWAAPWNKGGKKTENTEEWDAAYDGGAWSIPDSYKKTSSPTSTAESERTYPVTVHGFDFDFDNYYFPSRDAGDAAYGDDRQNPFSTGYIEVLMQFPDNVPQTDNAELIVEDRNMKATATNGDKGDNQTVTDDDKVSTTITLYPVGTITKWNSFTNQDEGNIFSTNNLTHNGNGFLGNVDYWTQTNDAAAFAGDEVDMWGVLDYGSRNAGPIYAANILQKFDSSMLSVDDTQRSRIDCIIVTKNNEWINTSLKGKWRVLYAADPLYRDGYTINNMSQNADESWTQTSINKEHALRMDMAHEDEYVYYENYSDLVAAGYTCVAVLLEVRDCEIPPNSYIMLRMPMKVVDDVKYVNQTASTVNTVRAWTDPAHRAQMKDLSMMNKQATGNGTPYPDDTLFIDKEDSDNNPVNAKKGILYVNNDDGVWVEQEDHSWKKAYDYYIKSEHSENGITGHASGPQMGMSLQVVSYKAKIEIAVKNKDMEGDTYSESSNFNMQRNEYDASYRLSGINTQVSEKRRETGDHKTGLTITVDVAPEVTVNKNNGIMVGDQNVPFDKPTQVTFTDKDGAQHTITVTASVDDNGDLVVQIDGAPLEVELPDITFDVVIDPKKVTNGQTLPAVAKIKGDGDARAYSSSAGNQDAADITITSLGSTTILKSVEEDIIEANTLINYELYYGSDIEINTGLWIYDRLPYVGDTRARSVDGIEVHSDYDGAITILEVTGKDIPDGTTDGWVDVYYTTKPADQISEDVLNLDKGDAATRLQQNVFIKELEGEGFQYAGRLNNTGDIIDLRKESGNISCLFFYLNFLPQQDNLSIGLKMQTDGNAAADIYYNNFVVRRPIADTSSLTSNVVQTEVISRSIAGLTWLDQKTKGVVEQTSDTDGLQTTGEAPIPGIVVSLYDQNDPNAGPIAQTTTGHWVNVTAKDDSLFKKGEITAADTAKDPSTKKDAFAAGYYEFRSVPAGTYKVVFTSGETPESDLAQYTATKVDAGSNDTIDSDGVPKHSDAGVLELTHIDGIAMTTLNQFRNQINAAKNRNPDGTAAEELYAERSPYHDSGFYLIDQSVTGNLEVSKRVSGPGANTTERFTFAVKLSDTTINGTYGRMTFINGVAEFTLKHGELCRAEGLPVGVAYTVSELEANLNEYVTTAEGEIGVIASNGTAKATFTNTRDGKLPDIPMTGDDMNLTLWTGMMLICAAALALSLRCKRRER